MVICDVADAIEKLGGYKAVAALTQRSGANVCNWRKKGWFPRSTYLLLSAELERLGYEAPPSLWKIAPPPLPSEHPHNHL